MIFIIRQAGTPGGARWRLWHPEQEVTGEDLWSDMLSATEGDLYLDTVANDPTLMEMSVSMASISQASITTASTTQAETTTATGPASQNVFKSKGKWLPPSEEIRLGHSLMTSDPLVMHYLMPCCRIKLVPFFK